MVLPRYCIEIKHFVMLGCCFVQPSFYFKLCIVLSAYRLSSEQHLIFSGAWCLLWGLSPHY